MRSLPICLLLCLLAGAARADDFRVTTRVFVGDEKQPAAENTTLFKAGRVYDFVFAPGAKQPQEVVVFDRANARFVILDPRRELRTELSMLEIETYIGQLHKLKDQLVKSNADLSFFLLHPRYELESDVDAGTTTFKSDWIHYRVKPADARSERILQQYAEFTDWYTRFNTLKDPSLLARFPINRWLREQNKLPAEIVKTTFRPGVLGGFRRQASFRAEHDVGTLVRPDAQLIQKAQLWLTQFQEVDYRTYAE